MSLLREAIRREILHHQVQRNDAATKDGTVNAPFAISDAKAKAEESKQEKERKKWLQADSNKEPPPRAGLAAAGKSTTIVSHRLLPPTGRQITKEATVAKAGRTNGLGKAGKEEKARKATKAKEEIKAVRKDVTEG